VAFERQEHALVRQIHKELNPAEDWLSYKCRCGHVYWNLNDWGYATREEARRQHKEHLKGFNDET
jgi:hypothetical protein